MISEFTIETFQPIKFYHSINSACKTIGIPQVLHFEAFEKIGIKELHHGWVSDGYHDLMVRTAPKLIQYSISCLCMPEEIDKEK